MRILIDYRPALRERTGAGEYIRQLVRALAGLSPRPDITVFSSSWKDRLDAADLPEIRTLDRRVPVRILNAAWHWLQWPPVELLGGSPVDVTHSPHPLMMPTRSGARVITIHDLDFLDHPERTTREIRRDYTRLARRHATRADRIIVPSRYTAEQVERRLGVPAGRISLCVPGAPGWPARSRLPADGYLLFVGTLGERKNLGTLLRAYGQIVERREGRAPELLLAGRSTIEGDALLREVQRSSMAGKVRHLGYVPEERKKALLEGAMLLVVPSLDEGFGLPALEAMQLGVPVVAADRGALPEVVGPTGVLVDPENPDRAYREQACFFSPDP